jgi:hypothetical protein
MRRRLIVAAILGALSAGMGVSISSAPALALRAWMQEAQIRSELIGLRLVGIYPSGVAWNELIRPDGTTDYEERGERRPGHWNVAGELFCFVYTRQSQGGCFRVVKHGANCYELYTASIGGQVPAEPPPARNMSWNGRMWRDGERSTCEEKNIS